MKSSFILHIDSLCVLDQMTDEQAGQFIKAIYEYQKTSQLPVVDALLAMALTPFVNQFNRDDEKYLRRCETNRENGQNGGRPKLEGNKPKKPNRLNGNPNNPDEAKKADNDSDSKNDSDSDNEKDNELFNCFWEAYDKKLDKNKALKAWDKLSKKEKQSAIDYIPTYNRRVKEDQFKKYPSTYLNGKVWEDGEVETSLPTLSILKAVRLDENDNVVYENGKVYAPQSLDRLANYKQGASDISIFDRKVS